MIDRDHALPLSEQAALLELSRSSLYYLPAPIPQADLELMLQLDRFHTEYPFAGARMLRDKLRLQGYRVGRRHVGRLMHMMGIEALYCKRRTTKRNPAHPTFPYLLRNVAIEMPNHVWSADITYIPMRSGFLYLFAILDWATRNVLAWRLSNSLTTDFCIDAVEEAIANFGCPQIFNTDQGSQFTDKDFVALLKGPRYRHQHGRQRRLAGQRVHRTILEIHQVQRGLSARLRIRSRSEKLHRPVHHVLQHRTTALVSRRANAACRILQSAGLKGGLTASHHITNRGFVSRNPRPLLTPWQGPTTLLEDTLIERGRG